MSKLISVAIHQFSNVNPLDKIIQLHKEKIALYEHMLKEKDEMTERLERVIGSK